MVLKMIWIFYHDQSMISSGRHFILFSIPSHRPVLLALVHLCKLFHLTCISVNTHYSQKTTWSCTLVYYLLKTNKTKNVASWNYTKKLMQQMKRTYAHASTNKTLLQNYSHANAHKYIYNKHNLTRMFVCLLSRFLILFSKVSMYCRRRSRQRLAASLQTIKKAQLGGE